jgi:hypothetical protein
VGGDMLWHEEDTASGMYVYLLDMLHRMKDPKDPGS